MPEVLSNFENFKLEDAHSYDPVIAEFDRATTRFTTPLAEKMVNLAALQNGQEVLDVGTGTGIVALAAARRVRPRGTVLGVDLSDPMLAAARRNAQKAGFNELQFRKMDAERLDLPDASFDAVLSLFALLHFPRPEEALQEMYRVLRPGGILVIAVGSAPPLSLGGLAHRANRLRDWLAEKQGRLLLAPRFLDSLLNQHLPAPETPEESSLAGRSRNRTRGVSKLVQAAGFTGIRSEWEARADSIGSPAEFWNLQRTYSSISRKRLSKSPPKDVAVLKKDFFTRCRKVQAHGGRLMYHRAAFYVVARRPLT